MRRSKFDSKLDAINRSSMSEEEKEKARTSVLQEKEKNHEYSIYLIKVIFAVLYFAMLGWFAYESLAVLFGQYSPSTAGVSVVNLVLGGLISKASDVFALISNGTKESKNKKEEK